MSNFMSMLQVMFIGLKLTGYINWPWVIVLLPVILVTIFLTIEEAIK